MPGSPWAIRGGWSRNAGASAAEAAGGRGLQTRVRRELGARRRAGSPEWGLVCKEGLVGGGKLTELSLVFLLE